MKRLTMALLLIIATRPLPLERSCWGCTDLKTAIEQLKHYQSTIKQGENHDQNKNQG